MILVNIALRYFILKTEGNSLHLIIFTFTKTTATAWSFAIILGSEYQGPWERALLIVHVITKTMHIITWKSDDTARGLVEVG